MKINKKLYQTPLSSGNTLEVFQENILIFHSAGKWLNPLFALEDFLNQKLNKNDKFNNLSVHDTAIGKAAVILLIHMGVKEIHGNIVSKLAIECVNDFNKNVNIEYKIKITGENIVDRLMCATEDELGPYSCSSESDINYMYFLIKQRAKGENCVLGVPIEVNSISYSFGNFKNLSFSVKAGGHLMVTGENGAGKSTLLKILAGIYKPLTGKILIDNKKISELPKFTIGYIPQFSDSPEYSLSVPEVVGLGVREKNKKETVRKALERTSSLNLMQRNFSDLSGGEKQKVSLARCLAQNAKILLLDEPTASLDRENRRMVIKIVQSLSVTEIPTIIIATHDKDLSSLPGWNILDIDKKEI